MKKILNKIKKGLFKGLNYLLNLQNKFTLPCDKLGHIYWGNHLWSNVGVIAVLLLVWLIPTFWLLLIPVATTVVPAFMKEKKDGLDSDGDGSPDGTKDKKDFLWTLASLPIKLVLLSIIIGLV